PAQRLTLKRATAPSTPIFGSPGPARDRGGGLPGLRLLPARGRPRPRGDPNARGRGRERGRYRYRDGAALPAPDGADIGRARDPADRKSTRLNSSHVSISYAVF